jgi:hypothetical protein
VVAESVRDDRCGEFQELLPDGGGDRDSDLVQERGQVVGAERLAGPAAGEEPASPSVRELYPQAIALKIASEDAAISAAARRQ